MKNLNTIKIELLDSRNLDELIGDWNHLNAKGLKVDSPPGADVLVSAANILSLYVNICPKDLPAVSFYAMTRDIQRRNLYIDIIIKRSREDQDIKKISTLPNPHLFSQAATSIAFAEGKDFEWGRSYLLKKEQNVITDPYAFVVVARYIGIQFYKRERFSGLAYINGASQSHKNNHNPSLLTPMNINDDLVARKVAEELKKPLSQLPTYKHTPSITGYNFLVRLQNYHITLEHIIEWVKVMRKNEVAYSKKSIRDEFELYGYDFGHIENIAKDLGLIEYIQTTESTQVYYLNPKNSLRIQRLSEGKGISQNDALNKALDDFFELVSKARKRKDGHK